ANFWIATNMVCEGHIRQANVFLDKVLTLDPMYPNALSWRAMSAFASGDLELAERLGRRRRATGLEHRGVFALPRRGGPRAAGGGDCAPGRGVDPARVRPPRRSCRGDLTRRPG